MIAIVLVPFGIQVFAITLDEFVFHRARGLPRWERIGHPIDTLLQLLCLATPLLLSFNGTHLLFFSIMGVLSCALITKDEHVHASLCSWKEHWLHSVLFIVHPVVLIATAFLWARRADHFWFFPLLKIQVLLMTAFGLYQVTYWSDLWRSSK